MDYTDIIDYLNGRATAAGREAMESWLAASPANRRHFQRVQRLWEASGKALQAEAPDVDAAWHKVRRRIRRPRPLLATLSRVAAAILLLLGGYWLWYTLQPAPWQEARQGEQAAAEALLLPDGSKVWLHNNSAVHYPRHFGKDKRMVRLKGEAYFEVAHDEAHPFLIETDGATVRVLGTAFGVMAYPDSSTAWVQVSTGRVAFYPPGEEGRQLVLNGGQGAVLDKTNGAVQRLGANAANRIAWRTGKLDFQNAALDEVALFLEETYGVAITFENPLLARCRFTASFDGEPLEAVLQTLNTLFQVEWRREGKGVLLRGEGCD